MTKRLTAIFFAALLSTAALYGSAEARDRRHRCDCPDHYCDYDPHDRRGYRAGTRLGALFDAIDPKGAEAMGLTGVKGAVIVDVEQGGPASTAGLTRGDVVVKVGDSDVASAESLAALLGGYPSGSTVMVSVNRSGRVEAVPVALSGAVADADTIIVTPEPPGRSYPYGYDYGGKTHHRDWRRDRHYRHDHGQEMRDYREYDRIYMVKSVIPDLTRDQDKRIDAVISGYEKSSLKAESGIREIEAELDGLLSADKVSVERAAARIKAAWALKADMQIAEIKALEDIKKVLTPVQRAALMEVPGYRGFEGCGR